MTLTPDDLLRPFHEAMRPRESWLIGVEAEKFGVDRVSGKPVQYEGQAGVRTILERLEQRHGWVASPAEYPGGPLIALERNRASITLEPGAQLELSGAPLADVHAISAEVAEHLAEMHDVSSDLGLVWLSTGFHPFARQEDLPWVPKLRYEIMKEYLPTRGKYGLDMMRRTATLQANFDYSSEEDAMRKMRVSLRISPLVTAMFANSPFYEGKLTGEKCHRARVWLSVDPDRQGLVPPLWKERATLADYVQWALDAPMFLIKREGKVVKNTGQTFRSFMADGFAGHEAKRSDWDMHLNTLFPEVRLKRTIEVRGADSLPRSIGCAMPALWTGILYDDRALGEADALTASWTYDDVLALRQQIAEHALSAKFRGARLADAAQALFTIAKGGLSRRARVAPDGRDETIHLDAIAPYLERAACPADDLVDGLSNGDGDLVAKIIARSQA